MLCGLLLLVQAIVGNSARNSIWIKYFELGGVSPAFVSKGPGIKEANDLSDS